MPASLTRPRMALLALAAAALAAAIALLQAGLAGASGDTVVTLAPSGEVRAGQLITVKLLVANASDLAGYQASVRFDPATLRLTGASVDAGLARSGRGLVPLGPVMGDGSVALGAATCPLSDCGDTPGAPLPRVEGGVAGTLELGTLEFYSAAPGRYQLSLEGVQLVDPQGGALPVRAEPLVIDVRP